MQLCTLLPATKLGGECFRRNNPFPTAPGAMAECWPISPTALPVVETTFSVDTGFRTEPSKSNHPCGLSDLPQNPSWGRLEKEKLNPSITGRAMQIIF